MAFKSPWAKIRIRMFSWVIGWNVIAWLSKVSNAYVTERRIACCIQDLVCLASVIAKCNCSSPEITRNTLPSKWIEIYLQNNVNLTKNKTHFCNDPSMIIVAFPDFDVSSFPTKSASTSGFNCTSERIFFRELENAYKAFVHLQLWVFYGKNTPLLPFDMPTLQVSHSIPRRRLKNANSFPASGIIPYLGFKKYS